jgi:hypothetical protein
MRRIIAFLRAGGAITGDMMLAAWEDGAGLDSQRKCDVRRCFQMPPNPLYAGAITRRLQNTSARENALQTPTREVLPITRRSIKSQQCPPALAQFSFLFKIHICFASSPFKSGVATSPAQPQPSPQLQVNACTKIQTTNQEIRPISDADPQKQKAGRWSVDNRTKMREFYIENKKAVWTDRQLPTLKCQKAN